MRQEEAASLNGIALRSVEEFREESCMIPLLLGEIDGAEVYYRTMLAGDRIFLRQDPDWMGTLVLIDGEVSVSAEGEVTLLKDRANCTLDPEKAAEVYSADLSHILEVRRYLGEERRERLKKSGVRFPIVRNYNDCPQYREDFKSRKSISRSMIDHGVLPDFCMGSNESYGPDRVEKHSHPMLDQFFFSFEDNDVDLLIDQHIQPYEGNTLIHIPLGSDHGVEIPAGKKMHYIWIDFMVDSGAIAYLDSVHKRTGVREYFGKDHTIAEERDSD